jgi:hypothetical protein
MGVSGYLQNPKQATGHTTRARQSACFTQDEQMASGAFGSEGSDGFST